jgi:predicted transcriptional regulator
LFFANLVLGTFNLIPALPMDGGRILRAALQLLGVRKATAISSRISQALSILMGLGGIYMGNPILVIVAMMVFSAAAQERFHEQAKTTLADRRVREVMTDAALIQTFTHGATVSQALSVACKSLQSSFPVVHGGSVIGLLLKDSLLQHAVADGDDAYVSGLMLREFPFCGPDEMISVVMDRENFGGAIPLLVLQDGKLLGMIVRDQLVEYLIVQGMRQQAVPRGRTVDQEF